MLLTSTAASVSARVEQNRAWGHGCLKHGSDFSNGFQFSRSQHLANCLQKHPPPQRCLRTLEIKILLKQPLAVSCQRTGSLHHEHDRAVSCWLCFNHQYQKGKGENKQLIGKGATLITLISKGIKEKWSEILLLLFPKMHSTSISLPKTPCKPVFQSPSTVHAHHMSHGHQCPSSSCPVAPQGS